MRKCLGKHSCKSSTFPLAILLCRFFWLCEYNENWKLRATNYTKLTRSDGVNCHAKHELFSSVCSPNETLNFGSEVKLNHITEGTVFDCTNDGVTLKLELNSAGFCFAHQAMDKNENVTISSLKEKYPIGNKFSCKPVAFNCVDNMFVVILNMKQDAAIERVS